MFEEIYYLRSRLGRNNDDRNKRCAARARSCIRPQTPIRCCQDETSFKQLKPVSNSNCRNDSCDSINECQCGSSQKPLARFKSISSLVVRCPTPPPVYQRFVERLPTPEPEIVERIIIKPQPQQYIERVIQRPRTPSPLVIDKEVKESPRPPIIKTKIVDVDNSSSKQKNLCEVLCSKPAPKICNQEHKSNLVSSKSYSSSSSSSTHLCSMHQETLTKTPASSDSSISANYLPKPAPPTPIQPTKSSSSKFQKNKYKQAKHDKHHHKNCGCGRQMNEHDLGNISSGSTSSINKKPLPIEYNQEEFSQERLITKI